MYLGKTKVKGVFIKTYVPKHYPKKLEQEEIDQLLIDLKDNDLKEKAKKRLFEGHIRIVMQIASRYVSKLKNRCFFEEELIDEAGLGLIEAINDAASKLKDNNITGYIISWVHMKISHFLRKELRLRDKKIINTIGKKTYTSSDNKDIDLKDYIEAKLTVVEKRVLQLRLEGYSDPDIGIQLNVSQQRVSKIRSIIKSKFRRIL